MPPSHVIRPSLPEGSGPGVLPAVELLVAAAGAVPIGGSRPPIVVADYGASGGRASLLPISRAVEALRARVGTQRSVLVVHTDRPDNDFTSLFRTLADDPASYLRDDPATFCAAVGRDFFEQVLPSDSVTLGWAASVTQSLRRPPVPVPDHIHVGYSADASARRAFAGQAARDWHDFVAYRGRELAPGGRLVVLTSTVDDEGRPGFEPLLDAVAAELDALATAGVIGADEARRMALPTYARTEAEFTAPFAPSGRLENLSVERVERYVAADENHERYLADGDARQFGARWAGLLRTLILPGLVAGLDGGRADPRSAEVADRIASGAAARLAAAPQPMTLPMARLLLVKRPAERP